VAFGGLAAATVALWAWNPAGGPPTCPLKAVTGLDCPFCGGLRGTHDLLHGDVGAALNQNLLLPLYLGLVAGGWLLWWTGERRGRGPAHPGRARRVAWALAVVLAVFTVVRNLPGVPFLPSGLG
jgi:hypothetical protein